MWPWLDRAGRFSALKFAVFAATLLPAIWLAQAAATSALGAKPVTAAIHESGDWAIRFLLLSLFVTPVRRITGWVRVIPVRRLLGLAALAYALLHLVLYAMDLNWDLLRVGSEIVLRIYLTIGFVALVAMAMLGATSTDAAIQRLGKRWNRLHQLSYGIALLGVLHFFMQSKVNASEAALMAGLFLLLMAYRLVHALGFRVGSPLLLGGLAVAVALATAGVEYAWYAIATTVPAARVFSANLMFPDLIRPAWWVLFSGLGVALLAVPFAWRRRPVRKLSPAAG
jgi:sulfoxide reductase heme-binding subunit YedZ